MTIFRVLFCAVPLLAFSVLSFANEDTSSGDNHIQVLTQPEFENLSRADKVSYIRELQDATVEFEESTREQFPVVQNRLTPFTSQWMSEAQADDAPACVIGGMIQPVVGGRCSSHQKNNGCAGSDQFRCGPVFGSSCIDRLPVNSISRRCRNAFTDDQLDEHLPWVNEVAGALDSKYQAVCAQSTVVNRHGCDVYKSQTSNVTGRYKKRSDQQAAVRQARVNKCQTEASHTKVFAAYSGQIKSIASGNADNEDILENCAQAKPNYDHMPAVLRFSFTCKDLKLPPGVSCPTPMVVLPTGYQDKDGKATLTYLDGNGKTHTMVYNPHHSPNQMDFPYTSSSHVTINIDKIEHVAPCLLTNDSDMPSNWPKPAGCFPYAAQGLRPAHPPKAVQ